MIFLEGRETLTAIYDIIWDVEGPLIHPGFDFAKEILRENNAAITDKLGKIEINGEEFTYFEAAFEIFDPYDDDRWFYDRTHNVEFKHSTGTTPVISLIICALMDWDDEKLTDFAKDHFLETPGCRNIHQIMKKIKAKEFLVSNSYPAQCLIVAKKKKIPFSDAYCMGYQLDDGRRNIEHELDKEVNERSPLELWKEHKDELKEFLDAYLQKAWELLEIYRRAKDNESSSEEKIRFLLSEQKALFEEIKNFALKESLKYFLDKKEDILEEGVMGGHRKKHTLQKIEADTKKELLLISDSIVDVDAIEYVKDNGLSITINCTQEDCLKATHVNIATLNWKYAENILKDLSNGNLKKSEITQEILERYIKDEYKPYITVFSMEYIKNHMKEVMSANKTVRDVLKGENGYELWKKDRNKYQEIWSNPYSKFTFQIVS